MWALTGCGGGAGGDNSGPDAGVDVAGPDAGSGGGGADETPPVFSGAKSAVPGSQTSIRVGWDPASDDVTAAGDLVYLVHVADVSGGHDFGAADVATGPGETRATVTGLTANTEYFFIVRARDEAGNVDDNEVEASAVTVNPDTTAPTFAGIEGITAKAASVEVSWSAASDDRSDASDLVYNVYVAIQPGEQDFSTPTLTSGPGATSATVTNLDAETTYHAVVRAEDVAGNEDDNTAEMSATTQGVSFSGDVQPILTSNCTGRACHDSMMPKQGLDLTAGTAYGKLVGVTSEQCGNLDRVTAGDTGASYLVRKITGDMSGCFVGKQMPSGADPLSAGEIDIIRAWIAGGAAND